MTAGWLFACAVAVSVAWRGYVLWRDYHRWRCIVCGSRHLYGTVGEERVPVCKAHLNAEVERQEELLTRPAAAPGPAAERASEER